jgi:plastocyanin
MLGRRLLVLMAVLLGLTALVTALAPRPTAVSPRPSESGRSNPESTASAPAPGASRVVTRTVDAASGVTPARVRARAGDTIRLAVRGKLLDTVELQGLDEIEPLAPEAPARFEFLAETPGEHAIVLLDADRRVGLLDIRARAR